MFARTLALFTIGFFSMTTLAAQAENHTPRSSTTIVLVHGAFADGSSWSKVIPFLLQKGFKVVAVQNPLTSLADDEAAVRKVIDKQTGPVILVGHSWGGTVITQAGTSDKVKALVYVSALAPDVGHSSLDDGKDIPPAPGVLTLKPDVNGMVYMSEESLAQNFAQDIPSKTAKVMAATQQPVTGMLFSEKVSNAAWMSKKNYYVLTSKDRMVSPELQHLLAKKLNAKTTIVPASHAALLSQPGIVANVILDAAAHASD